LVSACGNDHAEPEGTPTYLDDIAPILQARCTSCHGMSAATAEAQNCVRLDRRDSAADTSRLCTDAGTAGWIFGVHEAAEMLVDQAIGDQMPSGGRRSPRATSPRSRRGGRRVPAPLA
jgi:hypothetical protein